MNTFTLIAIILGLPIALGLATVFAFVLLLVLLLGTSNKEISHVGTRSMDD